MYQSFHVIVQFFMQIREQSLSIDILLPYLMSHKKIKNKEQPNLVNFASKVLSRSSSKLFLLTTALNQVQVVITSIKISLCSTIAIMITIANTLFTYGNYQIYSSILLLKANRKICQFKKKQRIIYEIIKEINCLKCIIKQFHQISYS